MLGLLLALAAVTESSAGLAELPPQAMAPNSCAMFLWDRATRQRLVMVIAEPATIRVNSGGVRSLAQTGGEGEPVLGFRPRASYGDAALTVELALTITPNDGALGGAVVRDGAITVTGRDGTAIVSPVAGLVGCQR